MIFVIAQTLTQLNISPCSPTFSRKTYHIQSLDSWFNLRFHSLQNLFDPSVLTAKEIEWIDSYHTSVRDQVGSYLKERGKTEAYNWLMRETKLMSWDTFTRDKNPTTFSFIVNSWSIVADLCENTKFYGLSVIPPLHPCHGLIEKWASWESRWKQTLQEWFHLQDHRQGTSGR